MLVPRDYKDAAPTALALVCGFRPASAEFNSNAARPALNHPASFVVVPRNGLRGRGVFEILRPRRQTPAFAGAGSVARLAQW